MNKMLIMVCVLLVSGCTAWRPSQPLTLGEAQKNFRLEAERKSTSKIYRQYVQGTSYLSFERYDEKGRIFGWYACPMCQPTAVRYPIVAIPGENNRTYIVPGRSEDFFVSDENKASEKLNMFSPRSEDSWPEAYVLEGKTLTIQAQLRKCDYGRIRTNPTIAWWKFKDKEYSDGTRLCEDNVFSYDPRYQNQFKPIGKLFVATSDDTIIGSRDSSVEADGMIDKKLETIKRLYDKGLISEEEYKSRRKEILDSVR